MKIHFNTQARHKITKANVNYYANPFTHPSRKMNEHDFIYMLDGEWKMGQDDEEYTLKSNSLLILGAGHRHYGISPCRKNTKTMYFHVSLENGDGLTDGEPIDCFTDATANKSIKRIFHEIVKAKLSDNDRRASILFDLLLCEIRESKHQTDKGATGERIKGIIQQNPERFFTNSELAQMAGVSVKSAETKFKELFGISIHQYILQFKIEQAVSYLKGFPEMSIKEIAFNLGFYDEYHFSKQFKKILSISPSQYKKQID